MPPKAAKGEYIETVCGAPNQRIASANIYSGRPAIFSFIQAKLTRNRTRATRSRAAPKSTAPNTSYSVVKPSSKPKPLSEVISTVSLRLPPPQTQAIPLNHPTPPVSQSPSAATVTSPRVQSCARLAGYTVAFTRSTR
jgi:hypothetical protein